MGQRMMLVILRWLENGAAASKVAALGFESLVNEVILAVGSVV